MQLAFAFMYANGDWLRLHYDQSDLIIPLGRQPIYSGSVARPDIGQKSGKDRGKIPANCCL
jgi:hypothetical protein